MSNPTKKRNVLVLEDEAFIAMMLQDELEAMGIHVIGPINNLKSATLLAETSDLDGALLDLNINGEYATEVADKLRARDIRFIFVTGYDRPVGLKYREIAVLHKPFTIIELRMALISLFEKQ
jgi:DNA-binding response OmpR family regulator